MKKKKKRKSRCWQKKNMKTKLKNNKKKSKCFNLKWRKIKKKKNL